MDKGEIFPFQSNLLSCLSTYRMVNKPHSSAIYTYPYQTGGCSRHHHHQNSINNSQTFFTYCMNGQGLSLKASSVFIGFHFQLFPSVGQFPASLISPSLFGFVFYFSFSLALESRFHVFSLSNQRWDIPAWMSTHRHGSLHHTSNV